ncbi:MAG: DUF2723 domain-containing protein [Candidatus Ozemobacteraceae bacterium]
MFLPFFLTTAFSFFILLYHVAPSVTFHDSGSFALAASCMGIPHPPGAPTWSFLASLFIRLFDFNDPAYGTNVFSALMGAATLGGVGAISARWARSLFPSIGACQAVVLGCASSLILAGSSTFLEQSLTTEQYTLQTAFLCFAVFLTTSLWETQGKQSLSDTCKRILLGGTIGLAIGNHLSQIPLILLPLFLFWKDALVRPTSSTGSGWKQPLTNSVLILAGLFLGSLIFLYVPLRSATNPLWDWGNVKTLERFAWSILRKGWATRDLGLVPEGFIRGWFNSYDFTGQLGLLGVSFALLGFFRMGKKQRDLLMIFSLVTLPYAFGILLFHCRQANIKPVYLIAYGAGDFHLLLYVAVCIGSAMGLQVCAAWVKNRFSGAAANLMVGLVIIFLTFQAASSIQAASLRNFQGSDHFLRALVNPLPANAVLLAISDNIQFNTMYDRYVRHSLVRQYVFAEAESYQTLLRREGILKGLSFPDAKVKYLCELIMNPDFQMIRVPPMTHEQAASAPVFVDNFDAESLPFLLPRGFLFELKEHPVSNQEVLMADQQWRKQFPGDLRRPTGPVHRLERDAWESLYRGRGIFYQKRKMWGLAAESFALSLEWLDTGYKMWLDLAQCLDEMGKIPAAIQACQRAIDLNEGIQGTRASLALLYLKSARETEAEALLTEEVSRFPGNSEAKYNLQLLRSKKSQ